MDQSGRAHSINHGLGSLRSDTDDDDDQAHIPLLRDAPPLPPSRLRASSFGSTREERQREQERRRERRKQEHMRAQAQAGSSSRRKGLKHIPRVAGVPLLPSRRRPLKRPKVPFGVVDNLSDLEEDTPHPRRVAAYCYAQAVEWSKLRDDVTRVSSSHELLNEDTVNIYMPTWPEDGHCILFCTYGIAVFWGVPEELEEKFLDFLRDSTDDEVLLDEEEEADQFDWYYTQSQNPDSFAIYDNNFLLPRIFGEEGTAIKLAVSYAIATSVKLETFEVGIEKTIAATQHIPQELAAEGKMTLSKKEVSKYIGELYIQKSSVNLIYDILDTPDHFWDQQHGEWVYTKCRKFLSIDQRVDVLNKRLDVLAELLDILRTEKSEQHSTRLEWIVIILIVVEVMIGVVDIVYNAFSHGHVDVL